MGQEAQANVKKKRLKKDCLCQKCCMWRIARQTKKAVELSLRYASQPNVQEIPRDALVKAPNFSVQVGRSYEIVEEYNKFFGRGDGQVLIQIQKDPDMPVKIGSGG